VRGFIAARVMLAVGCAVVANVAMGCTTSTSGTPIAVPTAINPTEPTLPTTRPSRTPPTTTPSTLPSPVPTPSAPPAGETLTPNDRGYVYIETKSGKTRCQLNQTQVGCEAQFVNAPDREGMPANGVVITADGHVRWLVGNLGDIPVVTLDYRTYHAQGWTIAADATGTRFTNDRTGHGGFVSIESVESF
jgi:hypothetical protein